MLPNSLWCRQRCSQYCSSVLCLISSQNDAQVLALPWLTLCAVCRLCGALQKEHEGVCATAIREVMLLKALQARLLLRLHAGRCYCRCGCCVCCVFLCLWTRSAGGSSMGHWQQRPPVLHVKRCNPGAALGYTSVAHSCINQAAQPAGHLRLLAQFFFFRSNSLSMLPPCAAPQHHWAGGHAHACGGAGALPRIPLCRDRCGSVVRHGALAAITVCIFGMPALDCPAFGVLLLSARLLWPVPNIVGFPKLHATLPASNAVIRWQQALAL
jgi:hypothetical protein